MRNQIKNYKKIYIYVGVNKINKTDYDKLFNCISTYTNKSSSSISTNFKLIIINYSEYKCETEFNWKRDYINFRQIFINK